MKIILIHLNEEEHAADKLRPLLKKLRISVETLTIKSFTEFNEKVDSILAVEPTIALILSSLPSMWLAYLAGFSGGSGLPLLVYGKENSDNIHEEISSSFILLENEAALTTFLKTLIKEFKKEEAERIKHIARQTLLDMGVPVNEESMAACAAEGNIEQLSLFLTAGFSPDTINKAGVPLLNLSARKGKSEAVLFLIQSGANINIQAKDRESTTLIDSVLGKSYDLAKQLIDAGADVNIRNRDGQSALILAVANGEKDIAEYLLKAGANPDIPDNLGMSARQYAVLFSRDSISSLIDSYKTAD